MYNLLAFRCSRPPMVEKEVGETRPERRNSNSPDAFYDTVVVVYGSSGAAETIIREK